MESLNNSSNLTISTFRNILLEALRETEEDEVSALIRVAESPLARFLGENAPLGSQNANS